MSYFAFSNSAAVPTTDPITSGSQESTKVAILEAPAQKDLPRYTVHATAYNAVPAQTDGNPMITASGAYSNPEVVAARSRDLAAELPFGTVIALERTGGDSSTCGFGKVEHLIGYRVIADTMHARMTNKIDVLLDQHDTVALNGKEYNPGIVFGVCDEVTIRVVGKVDIKDIPSTQAELQELFAGNQLALR
ncbi:hypothetical protein KKH15_02755 [Patescibacteria group bacterium]|nr:hypothetical protein [Patescibacteria group bacterium]MBU1755101.1 hypothetical protein [Patescibacteria group bacterium]